MIVLDLQFLSVGFFFVFVIVLVVVIQSIVVVFFRIFFINFQIVEVEFVLGCDNFDIDEDEFEDDIRNFIFFCVCSIGWLWVDVVGCSGSSSDDFLVFGGVEVMQWFVCSFV